MQDRQDIYPQHMRSYVQIDRPERCLLTIQRTAFFKPLLRPLALQDIEARIKRDPTELSSKPPIQFQLDPYLDYGRFLTAEGGILITYKDIDERWHHMIWRFLAWTIFTGLEANYLFNLAPPQNPWLAVILLLAAAIVNWLIVARPVELYRRIEIKPDCMIIDGSDVFWARFIEGGLPSCRPDAQGNQLFCGIYGTRFVEFLTIRRFDEHDRMPEVMADHLQEAMRQLWMMPQ